MTLRRPTLQSSGPDNPSVERPSRGVRSHAGPFTKNKKIMPGPCRLPYPQCTPHRGPRPPSDHGCLSLPLEICRLLDATCCCNLSGGLAIGQVVAYIAQVCAATARHETNSVSATLHPRDAGLACEHDNAAAGGVAIEAAPLDVDEGGG